MGPEVVVIFVIGLIAPMALVGLVAHWRLTAAARGEVEAHWERYARSRRLTFIPAAGEWPNRTAPALSWTEEDAQFRIEAWGGEALHTTRVVARATVAVCGTFALSARRSPASESQAVVTGDPLIDRHFVVEARPRQLAPRVLTEGVKRALLGFDVGSRGSLAYERGDVLLSWAGAEESDARLDEARELVRRVLRALDGRAVAQEGLDPAPWSSGSALPSPE